jgi:hypothetical protein
MDWGSATQVMLKYRFGVRNGSDLIAVLSAGTRERQCGAVEGRVAWGPGYPTRLASEDYEGTAD